MQKALFVLFALIFFFPKPLLSAGYSETISLSAMQSFSGLTRNEILNKRLRAVQTSPVFGNIYDYHPSEGVFQIEDGLPKTEPLFLSFGIKNNCLFYRSFSYKLFPNDMIFSYSSFFI